MGTTMKTTTRKTEIIRRVTITLDHREIGKGIAAYRIRQKTDDRGTPLEKREGLARVEDLGRLVSGELELRDLAQVPLFKRGDWQSCLISVKPEFLIWARDFGFNRDPDEDPEGKDRGLHDPKRRVSAPLSYLESGKEVHFVEFFSAASQVFDFGGLPIPVCLGFDYINAGLHNGVFKLKRVVEILSGRDDVLLVAHGGERSPWLGEDLGDFIGSIPGCNAARGQDRCVMFYWRPGEVDYQKVWARAVELCRSEDGHPSSDDLRRAVLDLDILGLASARKGSGGFIR